MGPFSQSEVTNEELVEAINDPQSAEALMERMGWTKEELLQQGERIAKQLADDVSSVNVV